MAERKKQRKIYLQRTKSYPCVYAVDHDNQRYSIAYTVINVNKRKLYTFLYSIIPLTYRSFYVIESLYIYVWKMSMDYRCKLPSYVVFKHIQQSNKKLRI